MTGSNNYDMFDPTTLVIDSDLAPEDECDHDDFTFAFSNSKFSDRVLHINISSDTTESTPSPSGRDQTLYISSPILAARSPFFYKLFSNGMKESRQCHATLRINATEEAGLMKLLEFMHSNNLKVKTASAVLNVLKVADKFDVASCIRYCGRLLRNLPMTPKSVLVYLNLPSTILISEAFQPLTIAVKRFYAVHFKDITRFPDEILGLSLDGVEAIIASDDLQVVLEDQVFHFVIKWAQAQYPEIEERRQIIATRLAKFIRYPYMTRAMLIIAFACDEFDQTFVLKVLNEAMCFQAEVPDKQHTYIHDETSSFNRRFVERAYILRPIKVVEFQQPRPHCVAYLELKRDLCANLFTSGHVYSRSFHLGNQRFYFEARRYMDRFRLLLAIVKKAGTLAFDCEFAIRFSRPTREFVSIYKKSFTLTGGKETVLLCLNSIPWTRFIREDSLYFIDDVYQVRVELTEQSVVESNKD